MDIKLFRIINNWVCMNSEKLENLCKLF